MAEASDRQVVDSRSMRHLSHDHILTLVEEQSEQVDWCCFMCDELIQGSNCYSCLESGCKFYLHKICAELPPRIDLPFFHRHTLYLLKKPAYFSGYYFCCICYDHGEIFYYCSDCNFGVDVKRALLPQSEAVELFSHVHPVILATKKKRLVNIFSCFACEEDTPDPIYSCVICNFYLHTKCAELPPKITHPSHRKHSLALSTNTARPFHRKLCCCKICTNRSKGFLYQCSLCKFDLKIKHIFSSQLEIGNHEHPFNHVSKGLSFICDACGTDGDCIPYVCTTCNLAVHKDCILLPKIIKISRHVHPISHTYFLLEDEFERWDCKICHAEVNTAYGNYYCLDCKYIVHVHCALNPWWLEVEIKKSKHEETSRLLLNDSETSATDITATEIKHFSHQHILTLGDEMESDRYCVGCVRAISSDHPFYFCKQCDFFLHKSCAILPMRTKILFYPAIATLFPHGIFRCQLCKFYSSGFVYFIESLGTVVCLRCFGLSDTLGHHGHKHPLFFDIAYEGDCSACGAEIEYDYYYGCKDCNFVLCLGCISKQQKTKHKNHIHPLTLSYHDDDQSEFYCDICEEKRNPSFWFYSCAGCDFTVHTECTLGEYPFIKRGIKFRHKNHPHRLVTVQKVYYYPPCEVCGEPCLDLAVECEEPECNYICDWKCLEFPDFFLITD